MRSRLYRMIVGALACCLLASSAGRAQSFDAQAIEAELSGATDPARRLPLLNRLAAGLIENAPDDALRYAEEAVGIGEKLDDERGTADASLNLSRATLKLNRFDRAQAAADRAVALYSKLNLPQLRGEAAFTRGNIAFARGDYREAMQRHEALLKEMDEQANPVSTAAVLGFLAQSSLVMGNFNRAFEFQARALALQRRADDQQGLATGLITLGTIEHARANLDAAIAVEKEGLALAEMLGKQSEIVRGALGLGLALLDQQKNQEAERYLTQAVEVGRRQKDPLLLPAALRGLGWVREKQSRAADAQALMEEAELNEKASRRLSEIQTQLEKELKARDVERLEQQRKIQDLILAQQTLARNAAIGGVVLTSALLVVAVNAFRLKRRSAEQLAAKNRDLEEANVVIAHEKARSETLLLSILPAPIASRLKLSYTAIADSYPAATVLFADIVGFTPLSRQIGAGDLVKLLDQIFTRFDALAERHKLEKIKTIGDCYMVVGGLPEPSTDHCERIAAMALDLIAEVRAFNERERTEMSVRVGFHVGPVVAGVIGRQKFSYDLWGDTVNTASRLESTGAPGQIHVSEDVVRALDGKFAFEPCGPTDVKGIGKLDTYFLSRRIDQFAA